MNLHELAPKKGALKRRRRVGRGPGSGRGTRAGRGQDGQLSRSGGGKGPGFEGGQTPLQRRLPKLPGFRNPFKRVFEVVNLDQLNRFRAKSKVDPKSMAEKGLIRQPNLPVKVLGGGEIEKALTVQAHKFSATAVEKIEKAGGKVEIIE